MVCGLRCLAHSFACLLDTPERVLAGLYGSPVHAGLAILLYARIFWP